MQAPPQQAGTGVIEGRVLRVGGAEPIANAQVFLNGGYAGTVKEVKSMWLRPGNYDVEVRTPGVEQSFATKVFVVAGKTIHVNPELPSPNHS